MIGVYFIGKFLERALFIWEGMNGCDFNFFLVVDEDVLRGDISKGFVKVIGIFLGRSHGIEEVVKFFLFEVSIVGPSMADDV